MKGRRNIFYDSIFNVTGFIADDKEHKIKVGELEGKWNDVTQIHKEYLDKLKEIPLSEL